MTRLLILTLVLAAIPIGAFAADSARYTVIVGGQKVGHVFADTAANRTRIDFNIKNNGRGPTGSIEKGKRADFFLVPGDPTKDLKAIKTIAMVVKDGVFYYPSEAYPKFGIEPFTAAPKVTLPEK